MDGRGEGGPRRVVLVLGCAEIIQPIGVRERTFQPIGAGSGTWRRAVPIPRRVSIETRRAERLFVPLLEQFFNSGEEQVVMHSK